MKRLNFTKIPALALLLTMVFHTGLLFAAQSRIYPGITENVRQALRSRYENGDGREINKLLYLVDLAAKTNLEILYDGTSFRTNLISPFIRLFVLQHYKNQSAEKWLREWCSTSRRGNPISVRFPDGTTASAMEVLMGELKSL